MPKNFALLKNSGVGAQGEVGPIGATGPMGPQGVPGPDGAKGERGAASLASHPSGGMIFKPMSTTTRVGIKDAPVGLTVFDSDMGKLFINTATGWCAVGSAPRRATTSS